jgi:predicted nucleic acid-binding protein
VVDASALACFFKGEEGHERVAGLLEDERNIPAIHAVTLCEVYYNYLKSDGLVEANQAWDRASKLLRVLDDIAEDFLKRVGRWKVQAKLGLGDSFLAACAEEHHAIMVTADHNDFDTIQQSGLIQIEFLR